MVATIETPETLQLIDRIDAFRDECEESQWTDAGEAWELLEEARELLAYAMGEAGVLVTAAAPRPEVIEVTDLTGVPRELR